MELLEQDIGTVIVTSTLIGLGIGILPRSFILGIITIIIGFMGLTWIVARVKEQNLKYKDVEFIER